MTHSFSRLDLREDTTYVYIISRHIRSMQHIRRATEYRIVRIVIVHLRVFCSSYHHMDGRKEGWTDRQMKRRTFGWLVG